jgi:hypothetical protein
MDHIAKFLLKRISDKVKTLTDKQISKVAHAPNYNEWRAYICQNKPHWEDISWRVKEPTAKGHTEFHLGFYTSNPNENFFETIDRAEIIAKGKTSSVLKFENGIRLIWKLNLNDNESIEQVVIDVSSILPDFLRLALSHLCQNKNNDILNDDVNFIEGYNQNFTSQVGKSVLYTIIGQENADRLINLYKENKQFYQYDKFDFEWLNQIAEKLYNELSIGGSNSRSSDIIDFLLEENHPDKMYKGTRISEKLCFVSISESAITRVRLVEDEFSKKAEALKNDLTIEKRENRVYHLFNQFFAALNEELINDGIVLQRMVKPRGGEDFDLFFYFESEPSDIINFLAGYRYARENYEGWWEDALDFYTSTDNSLWYNELVSRENVDSSSNDIIYGFKYDSHMSEDEYPSNNFEDLNISKTNLLSFIEGEFAAWHYSKIKLIE